MTPEERAQEAEWHSDEGDQPRRWPSGERGGNAFFWMFWLFVAAVLIAVAWVVRA